AWTCTLVVVSFNAILIWLQMGKWAENVDNPIWIYGTLGPIALLLGGLLVWLAIYPVWVGRREAPRPTITPELPGVRYQRIGVAVEFERADNGVLAQAAALARTHGAELFVVHVVEGLGAAYYGAAARDRESREDRVRMEELVEHLRADGLSVRGLLGYGDPPEELVRIAREQGFDLLVLGTHGHRFFADLALGQTVSPVLHRLKIPVLVVPTPE